MSTIKVALAGAGAFGVKHLERPARSVENRVGLRRDFGR